MPQKARPDNVVRFERIIYVAWALAVILTLYEWGALSQGGSGTAPWIWMAELILILGGEVWWIWLIARRRKNWARWTGIVLLVIAFPNYLYFLTAKFQTAPILASAYLINTVLWYVPFYFLFTGDAPAWFKPQPVASTTPEPPPL